MYESSITVKGQTTLPKAVRDSLAVKAGDKVRYVFLDEGVLIHARKVHKQPVRQPEVRRTSSNAERHGRRHREGSHRVMTALDTNVIVRYLVKDNAEQAEAARQLLDSLTPTQPGFICREVVIEVAWVLERSYRFPRTRISERIDGTDGCGQSRH